MRRLISCCLAASLALAAAPSALSQKTNGTWSQQEALQILPKVNKALAGLRDYSVFDWITYGIHGRKIVLRGYASRPSVKDEAENAVKSIKGVESVENQIEVLPLSTSDDRVRAEVYNRIYTQGALRKYNANQGNLGRAMMPGLNVGGITENPPMGFHAIHIIVNNGHVMLFGSVLNRGDEQIATMQANMAPGAFSVDSNLTVEGDREHRK
ncbi:MAG: BON domain-containing protein [Acidobacteria bacterium]|nr:BON domain-containing protein [Acidobacteriota bacterium]